MINQRILMKMAIKLSTLNMVNVCGRMFRMRSVQPNAKLTHRIG